MSLHSLTVEKREENFNKLKSFVVYALGEEEGAAWGLLLESLKDDGVCSEDGRSWLGLRDAPAGKFQHHAYLGGLVVHLLEMLELAEPIIELVAYSCTSTLITRVESPQKSFEISVGLKDVARVVLLHDLHKAHQTYVHIGEGRFEYTRNTLNDLVSVNMQSLMLARGHGLDYLDKPVVMNALEASEGGWAKVHPRFCTPTAKVCYLLDELSANVVSRILEGQALPGSA